MSAGPSELKLKLKVKVLLDRLGGRHPQRRFFQLFNRPLSHTVHLPNKETINKLPDTFWPSYVDATCENINEWFDSETVKDVELYQNITIANLRKLINDDFLCNHFLTVFYLFKSELSEENVKKYVSILSLHDFNILKLSLSFTIL